MKFIMDQFLKTLKLLRPYWRAMSQMLFVGILILLIQIPSPYFTKILIDNVYPDNDHTLLNFTLITMMLVSIGIGGTRFLSSYFNQTVGINIGFDFQSIFYKHIQGLDFEFFDKRETGEILSRFRDMRGSIANVIGIINTLVINILQLCIFPPILFYIHWKLALISMAILPFDTILITTTRSYIRRLSEAIADHSAELSAKNYASINGIRTVQALGIESTIYSKLHSLFETVARLRLKLALFQGVSDFIATTLKAIGTLAYGWYGWHLILSGHLSLGSYLAFTAYVGYLFGPIQNLIGLIRQYETTSVHINRFFEIYNTRPEIRDKPSSPQLPRLKGAIKFNNVSFMYQEGVKTLDNIELDIPARQTLALVGRSGSGKSTLAKLIPRFYDPSSGSISMDGLDIRAYRLSSLRPQIGFAMQGSELFQGTIIENLTFSRDIPFKDVEDAVKTAHINEVVESLPNGYETVVGENGLRLSEGQKQRLALARVLLMNCPILILDEPTSALDMESEHYVQMALDKVKEGRTTIVIAHRLSTIQNADRIIVLENGCIAETGSHSDLISNKGIYARLHNITARI